MYTIWEKESHKPWMYLWVNDMLLIRKMSFLKIFYKTSDGLTRKCKFYIDAFFMTIDRSSLAGTEGGI